MSDHTETIKARLREDTFGDYAAELLRVIEALPRYVAVVQDREGWTRERGPEGQPVMWECVMLADLRQLFDQAGDSEPRTEGKDS